MPRAAGSSSHYRWELHDSSGRLIEGHPIRLVSVTSVIKATLAAPALVEWAYRQTIDSVSGAFTVAPEVFESLKDEDGYRGEDYLNDAVTLDEWLKDNRLRPMDLRDERAYEGRATHKFLEDMIEGERPARDPRDGYEKAIMQWVWAEKPLFEASEQVVYSLGAGFAGTCDAVLRPEVKKDGDLVEDNARRIVDLKTRKAGSRVYDSDRIQVGAYALCLLEMRRMQGFAREPISSGVLVAMEDGTHQYEKISPYNTQLYSEAFINLLDTYTLLREVKK